MPPATDFACCCFLAAGSGSRVARVVGGRFILEQVSLSARSARFFFACGGQEVVQSRCMDFMALAAERGARGAGDLLKARPLRTPLGGGSSVLERKSGARSGLASRHPAELNTVRAAATATARAVFFESGATTTSSLQTLQRPLPCTHRYGVCAAVRCARRSVGERGVL